MSKAESISIGNCGEYFVAAELERNGFTAAMPMSNTKKFDILAISNVQRVIEETNGEYTVIVTSDHGGHDRVHGSDMDEDMTIPMFFYGPEFAPGKELRGVSILDIAPTIADIIGVAPAKEWEGKSLISDVNE